jgi:CheY-like chemotaxis protein
MNPDDEIPVAAWTSHRRGQPDAVAETPARPRSARLRRHHAARDGQEALAALAQHLPTLVITDINMPGMDGYELCQRIKDDPRLGLPVILLTSLSDPKDILRGLECGADNFIMKPYDEEFLLAHPVRAGESSASPAGRRQAGHGDLFRRPQVSARFRPHPFDRPAALDVRNGGQKNLELSREGAARTGRAAPRKNAEMRADLEMARELQTAFCAIVPSSPPPLRRAQRTDSATAITRAPSWAAISSTFSRCPRRRPAC